MESTYLSVDCENFTQIPYPGPNGTTRDDSTSWEKLNGLAPAQLWNDKSADDPFGVDGRRTSFFIDADRSSAWSLEIDQEAEALLGRLDGCIGHYNQSKLTEPELTRHRKLVYVSKYARSPDSDRFGLNIANCSLAQHHVEAWVDCDGTQCTVTKIRRSLNDTRPSTLTGFEHGVIADGFAKQFPQAFSFSVGSSPTEYFLANTSSFPFIQQMGQAAQDVFFTNVSVIPPSVFSRRLSLMLNTYFQLSTQPTGYWGGLSENLTTYGPDTLPAKDIDSYLPSNLSATTHSFFDWWPTFQEAAPSIKSPFVGATTTSRFTSSDEVFVCQFVWLALLFVISSTIFATGLFALVLKRMTLGPEVRSMLFSSNNRAGSLTSCQCNLSLPCPVRARYER
jgi:hypothetical protein